MFVAAFLLLESGDEDPRVLELLDVADAADTADEDQRAHWAGIRWFTTSRTSRAEHPTLRRESRAR